MINEFSKFANLVDSGKVAHNNKVPCLDIQVWFKQYFVHQLKNQLQEKR